MHLREHLLIVCVDALAAVHSGVLLAEVLDEQHDGGVARLLLGVDPGKAKYHYSSGRVIEGRGGGNIEH